ncbi:MAG: NADH-quinone oxidoreductase subunit A [Verrucomicrobiota bacterium]
MPAEVPEMYTYVPVLLQVVIAIAFAIVSVTVSGLLGKRGGRSRAKDTAYECGKEPLGTPNPRFSVKFYLVAMLFILFDIEVVFLYVWAIVYQDLVLQDLSVLWAMVVFFALFFVADAYAWKKGAFDWFVKPEQARAALK